MIRRRIILLFLTLTHCLLVSCTTEPVAIGAAAPIECGVTRGSFLGDWFDYYERALSFADCGMWQESESDLRAALKQRSKDKRRVYTLGMHFLSDYLPHRELGIALFNQGRYDKAAEELEISLSQFPSSKAEIYLKRIRLIQIERSKTDREPPVIRITSPKPNDIVNAFNIAVTGVVEDDSLIERIEVNGVPYHYALPFTSEDGEPVYVERTLNRLPIHVEVPLVFHEGAAGVEVVAVDIAGKRSRKYLPLRIDQRGPEIEIQSIKLEDGGFVRVQARVTDRDTLVQSIRLHGDVALMIIPSDNIEIDERLRFPHDAMLTLAAVDQAGNETQATVPVRSMAATPNDVEDLRLYIDGDDLPRTTQEETAYLEGEITSRSEVRALLINGQDVLQRQATRFYFNYLTSLEIGDNSFDILAVNAQGQEKRLQLRIRRQQRPEYALEERLNVAQFPFPCNPVSRSPCRVSGRLYIALNEHMVNRKRFQIVDRRIIEDLMDRTLSCNVGANDSCVAKVSDRLMETRLWYDTDANAMFTGNVLERINERGAVSVEIFGHMTDKTTGKVLTTVDVYGENQNATQFPALVQGLATRINNAFPLTGGEVLQVSDNNLTVGLARRDRVWQGMPLLVYVQSDNSRPDSGAGYSTCGNARLRKVAEEQSQAASKALRCTVTATERFAVITR